MADHVSKQRLFCTYGASARGSFSGHIGSTLPQQGIAVPLAGTVIVSLRGGPAGPAFSLVDRHGIRALAQTWCKANAHTFDAQATHGFPAHWAGFEPPTTDQSPSPPAGEGGLVPSRPRWRVKPACTNFAPEPLLEADQGVPIPRRLTSSEAAAAAQAGNKGFRAAR